MLSRFYQAVSRARSSHPSHQGTAVPAGNPRTEGEKSKAVRRAMDDLAKRGV